MPARNLLPTGARRLYRPKTILVTLITVVVVTGMVAPAALAATTNDPVTEHLNLGAHDEVETAPHPYIDADVTTSAQDLAQGTSHAAIAGYEDDSGDWVAGADTPFVVNTTKDISSGDNVNPYSFKPGHIEDSAYTEFPDKADRTWSNASRWTAAGTDSASLTIENSTVAAGVDGVKFSGSGISTGAHANFSAWDGELDSDESKRVLQLAMDIDALPSGTNVTVRLYDESDDYKEVIVDEGGTVSGNVFATSTGDEVFQTKLSTLSTTGSGSWGNIEKVYINMTGDADVTVSWLDLRRKGKTTLGEKRATTNDDGNDPDSDGDYDEFQAIYNSSGTISVHSMASLDSEYDDAVVHDLTYPARFQADGLDSQGEEGTYAFYWEDAENPGFDAVLNVTYSLELPSAIDLSYSNTEVRQTQKWTDSRYLTFEQASEVADSTNLSAASYSSVSPVSKDEEVSIQASSVGAGERFLIHYDLELTSDERAALESVGGAGAPAQQGGGGLGDMVVGFFTSTVGIVLTALTGIVIWFRRRG